MRWDRTFMADLDAVASSALNRLRSPSPSANNGWQALGQLAAKSDCRQNRANAMTRNRRLFLDLLRARSWPARPIPSWRGSAMMAAPC